RLGVALIRNVAHAERKRARDNGHDLRLRVGVRGNGIALRELESEHEQAVFSGGAVEYARFSPPRKRRRGPRPFYILRSKHRVIHALGRRGTSQGDQASNDSPAVVHIFPAWMKSGSGSTQTSGNSSASCAHERQWVTTRHLLSRPISPNAKAP